MRSGRRGRVRLAALVLLRVLDPVRRGHARPRDGDPRNVRPRPGRDRRCDRPEDPSDHRELAAQPLGPDLPARDAGWARPGLVGCERTSRSADLPDLRRGVQPDRVRRAGVPDARHPVSALVPAVHVREDAARPRLARGLHRPAAHDAGSRGASRSVARGADLDGLGLPDLGAAARDPRARAPGSGPGRDAGPPRPAGRRAPGAGLRSVAPRRDVLRAGALAHRGRPGVRASCLVKRGVYVLPGAVFESPGRFRISLTANDDMVERSIPAFAEAIAEARAG